MKTICSRWPSYSARRKPGYGCRSEPTPRLARNPSRQDNYEINPCRRLDAENRPDPNGNTFEVCEPHEADVWTLYGHLPKGGVEAIGDFTTREHAEEVFQRITGIPFGGSRQVMEHLREMHAGPKLLDALKDTLNMLRAAHLQCGVAHDSNKRVIKARAIVAEATGRPA
jgi:hypothetical protein